MVRTSASITGVERVIDSLGQLAADATNSRQFLYPRGLEAMESTKVRQQCPSPARPDPRNILESRSLARFSAALPVSRNGEAMGLVANPLNQPQGG